MKVLTNRSDKKCDTIVCAFIIGGDFDFPWIFLAIGGQKKREIFEILRKKLKCQTILEKKGKTKQNPRYRINKL